LILIKFFFVEICALLGYYIALSVSPVATFRVILLISFSKVKKSWGPKVVPKRRYRTTTQHCVIYQEMADLICTAEEASNHFFGCSAVIGVLNTSVTVIINVLYVP
jgi:hypothetical protein